MSKLEMKIKNYFENIKKRKRNENISNNIEEEKKKIHSLLLQWIQRLKNRLKKVVKLDLVALAKTCAVDGRHAGIYLPASQVTLNVDEAADVTFVSIDPGVVKAIEARAFTIEKNNDKNDSNDENNNNDTYTLTSTSFHMKTIGRSTSFVFDPKKNESDNNTQQQRQQQAQQLKSMRDDCHDELRGALRKSPLHNHLQLLIDHHRHLPREFNDKTQLKGDVFDTRLKLNAAEERKTRHILKQRSWSRFLRRVINACVSNNDGKRLAIIVLGNGGNFRVRGHHRSLSHQQLAWSLVGLGLIVVGVDEYNTSKVCWKCGNFLKIFKGSRCVQCSCDKKKHDRDANATFSIFSVFLSIATLGYRPTHFTSANPKPTKKPPDRQISEASIEQQASTSSSLSLSSSSQ
eukprot:CAMPEP_0168598220 /NCGR_PEP_ID=MMETSP0420-20121227/11245_1 /TAXON_ID=498008 /ORGANISM="Pessonella sp." /LENGTH=402 /DNA_ID=CAMNT_0008635451 /DNA_START=681 /DNA_END=1889 /DNA_ORIENTATION=-